METDIQRRAGTNIQKERQRNTDRKVKTGKERLI